MRFEHRTTGKLGPAGHTHIWGQRRTGFDGIQYVETPDGFLPMTDATGEIEIISQVPKLSSELEKDLDRVAEVSTHQVCT